jgi:hypothetical protein
VRSLYLQYENTGYVINTADLEGTPINDVVTMATQPSQTSHTTTLTDISTENTEIISHIDTIQILPR